MKKLLIAGIGLGLTLVGYAAAGPFMTMREIRTGLQSQDQEKLSENIDFPTLRQNLKDQLNAAMVKHVTSAPELKGNPFAGLAVALVPMFVDRMVDTIITPAGLANLMSGNAPAPTSAAAGKTPPNADAAAGRSEREAIAPTSEHLPAPSPSRLDTRLENARYSLDSTSKLSVWLDSGQGEQVRLVLTRNGLSWKLTNIILPDIFKQ